MEYRNAELAARVVCLSSHTVWRVGGTRRPAAKGPDTAYTSRLTGTLSFDAGRGLLGSCSAASLFFSIRMIWQ